MTLVSKGPVGHVVAVGACAGGSAMPPSTRRGPQSCPTPVPPKTMCPPGPLAASR